jgi:transcriptional regulator with XRE-family HTH domain
VCRIAKNLTQRQFAAELGVDEETVASIEQGRRMLLVNLAERMELVLGLPRVLSVAASRMPEVDLIPPWAEEFFACEREALAQSWFNTQTVPGLLQTEDYARAVLSSRIPYPGEEHIEFQTVKRMKRQEILRRPVPPTLSFVIWEAVLRDRIGGEQVHREQIRHLRACADLPFVSLQVLPLGLTTHAGLAGCFIILETPEFQRLVYCETQRGSVLVVEPNDVSIVAQKYAMLRSQSLNMAETKGLLDRLPGEL